MQSPSGCLVKYIICQRNVFVKLYQAIITMKGADTMPEISRFFSIRITMYYDEHKPPHFHAEYNG